MLTLQMGIDPHYVLDEIETYEIAALMDNSHLKARESWEQARLIAYVVAQCNSKKPLKPSDIAEFSWDKEKGSAEPQMKAEEYERLRKMAQMYAATAENKENRPTNTQ